MQHFVTYVQFDINITSLDVQKCRVLVLMGGGLKELRKLPVEAWQSLVDCVNDHGYPTSGINMLFKRVPFKKGDLDCPEASDARPIDVCSLLVRALSSVQVASLALWRKRVIHPSQFATHKGTLVACAHMGYVCEAALDKHKRVWCVLNRL